MYGDTGEVLKDNSTIMELLADNVDKTSCNFKVRLTSTAGLEESEFLIFPIIIFIFMYMAGPFNNNEKDPEIVLKANQLKADTVCTMYIIASLFILDLRRQWLKRCLSLLKKELMAQYQQKRIFVTF